MEDPKKYEFSEHDREAYTSRFFAMNPRLVKSGTLAKLWRESGTRGGGVASSMLPVLALETWPGKTTDRSEIDSAGLAKPSAPWTPWASQSYRRTARVAGIGLNSVARGYRLLAKQGLGEFATVPCAVSRGGRRTYYRLSQSLYAEGGPRFASIPGALLYGGHWMKLRTNASRHLYLVLAALDPVSSPEGFELAVGDDALQERRERFAVSWGRIEELSGLKRSTLADAIAELTAPIPAKPQPYRPYFERGGDGPHWYARTGLDFHWTPDHLNGRSCRRLAHAA